MKLKSTIAALLMTMSLSTFAVDLTLSPVYTAVEAVRSVLATAVGVISSPLATTAEASAAQKEQLQAIRNDAVDFLSNGELTERLSTTLEDLKANEDLQNKSNIELAALIVTALN